MGDVNTDKFEDHHSMAEEILIALRKILRQIDRHSRDMVQRSGLTLPQALVLRAVAKAPSPGMSMGAVAQEVNLSLPTVSGIVDRLVRADLLNRTRDTSDRRRVNLQLTPAGQEKHAALPMPLQDEVMERLEALSSTRCKAMLKELQLLVDLMGADAIDAAPLLMPSEVNARSSPPASQDSGKG